MKRFLKHLLVLTVVLVLILSGMFIGLVTVEVKDAMAAKAIRVTDLSPDDIYDGFVAAVADFTTLKNAIDDITGGVGGDTASLATLANETSADLTTDATALVVLGNELGVDHGTTLDAINDLDGRFMALLVKLDADGGITDTNYTATLALTNYPAAALSAPLLNASARTASVVTVTAISNNTGTMGLTTP